MSWRTSSSRFVMSRSSSVSWAGRAGGARRASTPPAGARRAVSPLAARRMASAISSVEQSLTQVAAGAGADGVGHDLGVGVHREHHDADRRGGAAWIRFVASTPSRFGIVTSIRTTSGSSSSTSVDGLLAVGGLADDVEALLGQRPAQPLTQQPMVVGEQQPDAPSAREPRSAAAAPVGRCGAGSQRTRVPCARGRTRRRGWRRCSPPARACRAGRRSRAGRPARPGSRAPSSATSSSAPPAVAAPRDRERAWASAWRSTLTIASWAMRNSSRSWGSGSRARSSVRSVIVEPGALPDAADEQLEGGAGSPGSSLTSVRRS